MPIRLTGRRASPGQSICNRRAQPAKWGTAKEQRREEVAMPTIDADAHVIETPKTWSYMTEQEQDLRPQIFVRDPGEGAPVRSNQRREFWVLEGRLLSKGSNIGKDVPAESGTMEDIVRRLAHMDEIGVDVQILFPSLFLRPLTPERDTDFALARSYNRWLADIWSRAPQRLRWVAVPPLLSLADTGKIRDELAFCKEHGACGIFMRGVECDRLLNHRHFFPLYEIAQELDLAICLHAGINSAAYHDMFQPNSSLVTFKFPVIGAFAALIEDEIPRRFAALRWAFIEASAQWVPYALGEARIRLTGKGRRASDRMMSDNNFYVTTQRTDDLPWLLDQLGDDNLVIGTDYGHKDTATDVMALKRMSSDGNIPAASARKILEANPSRLYAI
jgi:predicted TIM-barrel fold metal-dependent hydrolase